jgi:hypothetical protein
MMSVARAREALGRNSLSHHSWYDYSGIFRLRGLSLRETATPLKMTIDLWLLRLGDALAVGLFENRVSASLEQGFTDRFPELNGVGTVARLA